jgi:serine/threonine-protein kinase
MAYVEGEPLSTRLKEAGRLGVAETMSIVAQAADALHAAHLNGTVHRDVKPGNLIVKPTGAVILVDFGVARSAAVTSVTGLNAIVGTALYMAPEQVAKGNVTPATDIYALGAVAYHCIAGRPPFDGDNALQVALRHLDDDPDPLPDDVPVAVRELISKAMAKHPDDRFASAADFADAALAAGGPMDHKSMTGTALTAPLSPAASTRVVPSPRVMPFAPTPPRRTGRSGKELAVLLAVIFLGLAAAGLAAALIFAPDSEGEQVNNPGPATTAEVSPSAADEGPVTPTESAAETLAPVRPNGVTPRPSSPPPSRPPSTAPSSSAPTSPPPSSPPPSPSPPSPTPTEEPTPGEGGGEAGAGA